MLRDCLLAEVAADERRLRCRQGLGGDKAARRSAALNNANSRKGQMEADHALAVGCEFVEQGLAHRRDTLRIMMVGGGHPGCANEVMGWVRASPSITTPSRPAKNSTHMWPAVWPDVPGTRMPAADLLPGLNGL